MEKYLILTFAAATCLMAIPLLVRLGQRGFSVWVRLYVAMVAIAIVGLCQVSLTGDRPIGYFPEILLGIVTMVGVGVSLIAAYSGDSRGRHEQVRPFHS